MNLNDPFGRLSKQQEIDYASLRHSLAESDVDSQEKAEALLANIRYRALGISAISVVLTALIVFFQPQLKIIFLVICGLILLWLFTTTFKGKRLIQRYIKEEFPRDT